MVQNVDLKYQGMRKIDRKIKNQVLLPQPNLQTELECQFSINNLWIGMIPIYE